MKIKHTDVCQEDFPTHSIFYEVVKVDIALACLRAARMVKLANTQDLKSVAK